MSWNGQIMSKRIWLLSLNYRLYSDITNLYRFCNLKSFIVAFETTNKRLMVHRTKGLDHTDYYSNPLLWRISCVCLTCLSYVHYIFTPDSLSTDSRIQTYLLAFLESSPHRSPVALPGGLAPISKELEDIAVRLGRLVNFNKLVYSPFYQDLLQAILTDEENAKIEPRV